MDLHGKVTLITGGTMGIGAAIAVKLAELGSDLAVVARNLGQDAEVTRRRIEATGRRVLLFTGDLSREADCTAAVETTVKQYGRLDVLVHNAGGPAFGKTEDITPEFWRQTLELHVSANFYLAKVALPHLRKAKEGAIITVSSTAGILGVPGAIAYATAKGALPQFTRCLARDLADDNIRVNGVAPGVIRTRFHADITPERKELNLKHRIPLHREGTPQQVADVVAMLVTNDYITGETVVIDGGLTSRIA